MYIKLLARLVFTSILYNTIFNLPWINACGTASVMLSVKAVKRVFFIRKNADGEISPWSDEHNERRLQHSKIETKDEDG